MVLTATGGNAAAAAPASKPARLLGLTHVLAQRIYGRYGGFACQPLPSGGVPALGVYCDLAERGAPHYTGAIGVVPYAASEFGALVSGQQSSLKLTVLRGLGRGALFGHDTVPANDVLIFRRGSIAVLLYSYDSTGEPANVYPTKRMYLLVAHAVYAHLRSRAAQRHLLGV
ncbi:MAG: hypothetical protein ACP5H2_12070 [Solirubrobacteraceae bacterium]